MSAPETEHDPHPSYPGRRNWPAWIAMVVAAIALAVSLGQSWPTQVVHYPSAYESTSMGTNEAEKEVVQPEDVIALEKPKAFKKFVAAGKADVKKWSHKQHFDKSAQSDNVALAYLCLADSTEAGRYYAASKIDEDQDWAVSDGEVLGNPRITAREWCVSIPPWAKLKDGEYPSPGE